MRRRSIVITDRAMPGMNGDQVAAALKKRLLRLPVVLLTGDVMFPGEVDPSLINGVLEKPATQREVIQMIDSLTFATRRPLGLENSLNEAYVQNMTARVGSRNHNCGAL